MSRTRISLDGTWDFFYGNQLSLDNLDQSGARRDIVVPGPWQAQFDDLRDAGGIAWYRRTFDLQATPNYTSILHFGAVDYHATVWLNGQLIGEHEGGYLPFELVLDRALQAGKNELVVRVIDPENDYLAYPQAPFSEVPHGKQSWYGAIGGIWQSVYIEQRPATYIKSIKITPQVAAEQANVIITLNQPVSSDSAIELNLVSPNGESQQSNYSIAANNDSITIDLPVSSPILWDTVNPNLYSLTASLSNGDSLTEQFGMREFTRNTQGQLLLNGKVIYLRGALDQDYYPDMIYTAFDDQQIEDQFLKAKHLGLNCLRIHIKVGDPRYYAAADRLGLLIWTELPNWENLTETTKRRAYETITGMIERDWNHPSIVIWTIINEGWGLEMAQVADHRDWLAKTYNKLKDFDPSRLFVGNSACLSNFQVATDIADFHNYNAIPDHAQQWREWVDSYATRADWIYAHKYESYKQWKGYLSDPWRPQDLEATDEVEKDGTEPLLVSEFGNWGLPNVDKLIEGYGGKEPWWFETGMEWGEGVVYPHGIQNRFRTFHLDKVFGDLNGLSQASQMVQYNAMKYEIEQMRRHANIIGYVITEFTDVHWEANGLLDMRRNPKAYHDIFATINSDNVVFVDPAQYVFWEEELFEMPIQFSYFGSEPLSAARLEWKIEEWGELSGSLNGINCQPGSVSELGYVSFHVPNLTRSSTITLKLVVRDVQGQIIAQNSHRFYAFANELVRPTDASIWAEGELASTLRDLGYSLVSDLSKADVVVTDTLTDELRNYLQAGGKVLWTDASTETLQTIIGDVQVRARKGTPWQGDWASSMGWINENRLFRDLPTNNLVDFAFNGLTPDYIITGLKPREFLANVHAGLFVGWIHRTVATIAERRFANGRLILSTFRLAEQLPNNPVAQIMIADLIEDLVR